MLWENKDNSSKTKIPLTTALTIYSDSALGRETYTNQRKLLASAGFNIFPAWGKLREQQKEITPDALNLPSPHTGVYFPLIPAIKTTISRILPNVLDGNVDVPEDLRLKIKFGFDGSGSHAIYNQVNNIQTNNIIMSMVCPLSIETSAGNVVWTQDSPNDPRSQRPVALQMGKESYDNLKSLAIFNDDITTLTDGVNILGKNIKTEIS